MVIIEIKLDKRVVEVSLNDGKKLLDRVSFAEKGDLTEKMLPLINRLIKKNKFQIQDIQKMVVESDLKEPFTSYRILKTIERTFNYLK